MSFTHCPHCGTTLEIKESEPQRGTRLIMPWAYGFEFRSQTQLYGLPLLHVAFGYNPRTGLPHLARGIIAIGNFAVGGFAIGGIAAGGFVISGIGLGIGVLAGIAVGWVAIGGIAVGGAFAIGGLALSGRYAAGALALLLNP